MLNKDIIEVEKKWAQKVVTNARSILLRNKKIASGTLYNSIRYNVSSNGSISFEYAPEGKWVESGRRKGARQPHTNPIEKWIKEKGIKGRDPKTGRYMSHHQLAYLIARGISRDGIKPVPFMQMAIDQATQQLMVDLEKQIAAYYEREIAKA
jgi:hypothetical protein